MKTMVKENNKRIICIFTVLVVILTSFLVPVGVYGETEVTAVQNPIYSITLNPNGGKVSTGSKIVQYTNIYGSLPTPTRSKYTFRGWYTATKGGSQITQYSTVNKKSTHILYARWQKNLSYEKEVVKYVNKQRKKSKLKKLKWDKKLYKGTKVRAKEITSQFSHVRPNGGSGARFLLKYVKKGRSSGECLGMGFNEPEKLVTAFMNSPSHKRIIMMKKARTCAVSARVGGGSTYWCLGTSALYR